MLDRLCSHLLEVNERLGVVSSILLFGSQWRRRMNRVIAKKEEEKKKRKTERIESHWSVKGSDMFQCFPADTKRLLPPSAAAPPTSGRGGAGSCRAGPFVRGSSADIDLPLLDLAAGVGRQVLDLLLGLKVEHDITELLLELPYRHVLQLTWGVRDRHGPSVLARLHTVTSAPKALVEQIIASRLQRPA